MLSRVVDALNALLIKGKDEQTLLKTEVESNINQANVSAETQLILEEKYNILKSDYDRTKALLLNTRDIAKDLGASLQKCLDGHT